HLPFILESLKYLDANVPQLWNSNMYMTLESTNLLVDVIDIWLPDLKYGNNECAWRLSKVRNYWEITTRNIKIAHDTGDMIIRHLVLPNHIECCTRTTLEWIAKNAPRALVNVMEQYRPEHIVAKYPKLYPDIARRLKREEIYVAYKIAEELGLVYKPVS
ncbi:MAG: pyruvate formate lyase-activating protein, partial [Desulfurococcaceae archaeon]